MSIFIRRFRMWACHHRCGHTLDFFSDVVITEEITHSFQDVTFGRQLVAQWLAVWEVPNKAVEKDYVILRILMKVSSLSEAWRALVIMAAETHDAASNKAKKVLEGLEIGSAKNVGEYLPE